MSSVRAAIGQLLADSDSTIVMKGARSVLIIQGFGFIALFLSQIYIAQMLGAAEYGVYVFGLSLVTLLGLIAAFGLPVASIRLTAKYLDAADGPHLRGVIAFSQVAPVITAIVIGALTLVVVILADEAISAQYRPALIFSVFLIPALATLASQTGLARGLGRASLAYWPQLIGRPLAIVLGLFIFGGIAGMSVSGRDALVIHGLGLLSLVIFVAWSIHRSLPDFAQKGRAKLEGRAWAWLALPLLFVALFDQVMTRSDLIFLGVFRAPEDVGIYNAASRIAYLMQSFAISINALAAGRIAALYERNATQAIQWLVTRLVMLIFWPTLAVALILGLFGTNILSLFGNEFRQGFLPLLILMLAHLLSTALSPSQLLMNMTGHQSYTAKTFGACAILNILLILALVPPFGMIGAAIATGSTLFVWHVVLAHLARKLIGIRVFPWPTSTVAATSPEEPDEQSGV